MILAGTRPPEYDAALQAARDRRAAAGDAEESGHPAPEVEDSPAVDRPTSAVDIAPRPPAD